MIPDKSSSPPQEVTNMADRWFYRHEGKTRGPVTAAEIEQHATTGQLHPADLLWAEGADPSTAGPAQASVRFPALMVPPQPAPDWLRDVRSSEARGQKPEVGKSAPRPQIEQITPMNATPNWLEDVRRAEQIAAASPRGRPAAASAPTAHRNVTGREGPPPSVVGRYGDSVLIAAVVTAVLVVLGGLAFTGRYLLTTRTTTPEADKPIDNVSDVPATEISPRSR